MTLLKYFVTLILFQLFSNILSAPEDDITKVRQMVIGYGYPFEIHTVETEDGYMVTMHRIPNGSKNCRRCERDAVKPPLFIKHGLGETSALYLIGGPKRSLALMLADQGYDVWLGNSRGTTFSRNHTKFMYTSFGFWNFSWHEIGLYDNTAMMNYIMEKTGHDELFYLCHSEGCTELYVLLSMVPKYNKRIKFAVNLAPAVYFNKLSGIVGILARFSYILSYVCERVGHANVLDGLTWFRLASNLLCTKGKLTQRLCSLLIYSIAGFSPPETNKDTVADFLAHFPGGGSTKQLFHYGFHVFSPGKFHQYDYGPRRNQLIYNSRRPPEYPMQNVDVKSAIFAGSKDFLAAAYDVNLLVRKLKNVVYNETVQGFNHFDFLVGLNAPHRVYTKVIELFRAHE